VIRAHIPHEMNYNLFVFIFVVISSYNNYVKCDMNDFSSVPTTVKAQENNTVLLPCYLNTASNGKRQYFSNLCLTNNII
jgi:hypothetical protein